MNPGAFEILSRYNLNLPRCFSLAEVLAQPLSALYYFRFRSVSGAKNTYLTGKDIKERGEEIAGQLEREEVLIEATYDITSGGVSLIRQGFAYSELVKGHPIMLLRRGRCGARMLHLWDREPEIRLSAQGWEAAQRQGFNWFPSFGPMLHEAQAVAKILSSDLPRNTAPLLIEWFVADNTIVFCDARDEDLDQFGNEIPRYFTSHDSVRLYDGLQQGANGACTVDRIDIDYDKELAPGGVQRIVNGAFLCHYVTRSAQHKKHVRIETLKI
jgi:hypothetical protein